MALLSRHAFEKQDYGGHFQFALTAVSVFRSTTIRGGLPVSALLGRRNPRSNTIGADFHMVEFIYRF